MQLYLAAETAEMPGMDAGLRAACVDYHFDKPFPDGLPPAPEGVMVLGGDLSSRRLPEIVEACRKRSLTAVLAGFGHSPALETERFCDGLLRRGLQPILTEYAWHRGCGGEMLLSAAQTGGDLRERIGEAKAKCPSLCLDLERLCRAFPPGGSRADGEELGMRELSALLRRGAAPAFSEALLCKTLEAEVHGARRMILFDDRETLCRKAALAAALGVERGFLLYPEWSAPDALAASEAAESAFL